jgi:hypothetical protein
VSVLFQQRADVEYAQRRDHGVINAGTDQRYFHYDSFAKFRAPNSKLQIIYKQKIPSNQETSALIYLEMGIYMAFVFWSWEF